MHNNNGMFTLPTDVLFRVPLLQGVTVSSAPDTLCCDDLDDTLNSVTCVARNCAKPHSQKPGP
jgi:hypothetical protein